MIGVILQTLFLEDTEVSTFEDLYYQPKVVDNCYGINNWLIVNIDTKQICLKFDNLQNAQCAAIPNGIYLDIKVNNHPANVIRGQFDYYDYQTSETLCYDCPNIDGDEECNFIFATEAAEVQIKSLTKATILPIGQIQITHNQYSQCFDQAKSQAFWRRIVVEFELYDTGLCQQFAFQYEVFTIILTTIEDKQVTITINAYDENGVPVYEEIPHEGYTELRISYDFEEYVFDFYNSMDLSIQKKLDTVTVMQDTQISLIQAQRVREMYTDPTFTIWSTYFLITASPLENSEALDEEFTTTSTQTIIRIQFFDIEAAETIDNLIFLTEAVSFTNPGSKLMCSDSKDPAHCLQFINTLNTLNLGQIKIVATYQIKEESGFTIVQTSSVILLLRRTCWRLIEANYYRSQICVALEPNFLSNSCPYKKVALTRFAISQGDFVITAVMNYSLAMSEICIPCTNCQNQINDIYQLRKGVSIKVESEGEEYLLESEKEFNMDYGKLHNLNFFLGMGIIGVICAIATYRFFQLKNGKKTKAGKKIEVDEFD